MRVVVFGAGAVGGLFGALLAHAGHRVLLVGRPSTVTAVRERGLRLEGRLELTVPVEAAEVLPQDFEADVVLLTVKAKDVPAAGSALARSLARPSTVVALQNGLGVEETLRTSLREGGWTDPDRWVLRAVHYYGATLGSPGVVRYAGEGEVLLPDSDGPLTSGSVGRVAELLTGSGLRVRRVPDLPRELWRKALVNAAINPVTADHGVRNGALLSDPLRGQAERLLREAQQAARAAGQSFSDSEADRELWTAVRATAENRSSMLQDLDRHRPTEIDQISGYLLEVAARAGIDLPETRRAIERIRRREAGSAAR